MPTWIYGLACPESGMVRYVGQSVAPHVRVAAHASSRASRAVSEWHQELATRGQRPSLVLFERVSDGENADAAEREWIARFGRFGDLLNLSPGPRTVVPTVVEIRSVPLKVGRRECRASRAIRAWLKANECGQVELAALLGAHVGRKVSQPTVSGWCSGKSVPGVRLALALQATLGIEPEWWMPDVAAVESSGSSAA